MGMLLFVDVCIQQSDSSFLTELSAENTPSLDCIDHDLDLSEEHQITFALSFLSGLEQITVHNYFHFINRSTRPCFPVWQPPKFC